MADANSMLMQMCTESVYNDNVFHLLGLRTTATPRQIRRRREDFESAQTLGGDAWKNEFRHLLGNRSVPTPEEVNDAFSKLEDPECRIISEFFWMWPTGDDDRALDALASGRKSEAFKIWEQDALGYGKKRSIAQHNLAVVYHFYALDAELQIVDGDGHAPTSFHESMCDYWEKSFAYWEDLADSDDFWAIYEARMREFDDPRLTGGFVRRFRSEFPIAFDNINARLAARYAKLGCYADAKRHVDYMTRTMSGLDDVQENMNIVFTPMEQRVKMLVEEHNAKVKADPKVGLEYANRLLDETEEIRRVVLAMLKDGQQLRTSIFTQIVTACNRYQVQYGNSTDEWEGCKKLLERLKVIACTPESKKIVEGNLETVEGNIKYDKEKNTCWVCRERKANCRYSIKMYGDVRREWGVVRWRHGEVDVPVCMKCREKKDAADTRGLCAALVAVIGSLVIGCCIAPNYFILWVVSAALLGAAAYFGIGNDNGFSDRCKEYPAIKELLGQGWKFGEKPPTN
jgi:hypothetical protein